MGSPNIGPGQSETAQSFWGVAALYPRLVFDCPFQALISFLRSCSWPKTQFGKSPLALRSLFLHPLRMFLGDYLRRGRFWKFVKKWS